MDQHTLRQPAGAKQTRKRLGRGNATGQGTYAGRGRKGQKARNKVRVGFEGGQNPLVRRVPHLRGFRNFNRIEFQAVNLEDLAARLEGETSHARPLKPFRGISAIRDRSPLQIRDCLEQHGRGETLNPVKLVFIDRRDHVYFPLL